jgi:hypothetical protein
MFKKALEKLTSWFKTKEECKSILAIDSDKDVQFIEVDIDKESLDLINQAKGDLTVEQFIEQTLENWFSSEAGQRFDEEYLLNNATIEVLNSFRTLNFPITYRFKKGRESNYIVISVESDFKALIVKIWPIYKQDKTEYSMTITQVNTAKAINKGYQGDLSSFKNPLQKSVEWFKG